MIRRKLTPQNGQHYSLKHAGTVITTFMALQLGTLMYHLPPFLTPRQHKMYQSLHQK